MVGGFRALGIASPPQLPVAKPSGFAGGGIEIFCDILDASGMVTRSDADMSCQNAESGGISAPVRCTVWFQITGRRA